MGSDPARRGQTPNGDVRQLGAVLELDERRAHLTIRRSAPEADDGWPLEVLYERDLI